MKKVETYRGKTYDGSPYICSVMSVDEAHKNLINKGKDEEAKYLAERIVDIERAIFFNERRAYPGYKEHNTKAREAIKQLKAIKPTGILGSGYMHNLIREQDIYTRPMEKPKKRAKCPDCGEVADLKHDC